MVPIRRERTSPRRLPDERPRGRLRSEAAPHDHAAGETAGPETAALARRTVAARDPLLPAAFLSCLVLLPLVGAAAIVIADGIAGVDRENGLFALRTYAVVLLSLLGGIRIGLAMRTTFGRRNRLTLAWSFAPIFVGWIACLAPPLPGLALVAVGFAAQGAADVWATEKGQMPPWYGRLRLPFTLAAPASVIAAMLAGGG
jgi:hypothetical protein